MATPKQFDFKGMTPKEIKAFMAEAEASLLQSRMDLLDNRANSLNAALKAEDIERVEFILHFSTLLDALEIEALKAKLGVAKKTRAKRGEGKAKKGYKDLDSKGNRPEVGVTYKLPNGEKWTRKPKGKSTDAFAEHAKTTTWAAMKA